VETSDSIFMEPICHSEKLSTRVLEQKRGSISFPFDAQFHSLSRCWLSPTSPRQPFPRRLPRCPR